MYIAQFYHPVTASSITTHSIVKGLIEKGHYVDLLVPLPCVNKCPRKCFLGCNEMRGMNVRRIPLPTFSAFERHLSIKVLTFTLAYLPLVLYALIIATKKKFDLVIAMYHATHLAPFSAFVISVVTKVPLMIKCHDVVSSESRRFLWQRIYINVIAHMNCIALKHAKRILALSNDLKLLMKGLYKIPDEKFIILPNGVDVQMFRSCEDSSDIRRKLHLQGKRILLHIGSLRPSYRKRGLEFLIEAMPKIVAKVSDLVLVILGPSSEEVQRELEDLAFSLNIEKRVRFIGRVPHEDMPMYISIAEICIGPLCPSLDTYGSTPRKVLEYMACAKPVVACHGGVAHDLVIDGCNGCLVRYEDLEDLASCILKLVKNQRSANRVGLNARSHVMAFYDQRVLADKLNTEILGMQ